MNFFFWIRDLPEIVIDVKVCGCKFGARASPAIIVFMLSNPSPFCIHQLENISIKCKTILKEQSKSRVRAWGGTCPPHPSVCQKKFIFRTLLILIDYGTFQTNFYFIITYFKCLECRLWIVWYQNASNCFGWTPLCPHLGVWDYDNALSPNPLEKILWTPIRKSKNVPDCVQKVPRVGSLMWKVFK